MARSLNARSFLCLVVLPAVACSSSNDRSSPDAGQPKGLQVEIKRPIKLRDETRVPQDDPNYERAEVTANSIAFVYKAKPTIALQAGHVVVGNGASPYLRRIVEVTSSSDTRVEVKTEAAYLTDAISDGAFRLVGTPAATDWVVDPARGISGRKVFLDTKIKLLAFDDKNAFNCEVSGGGGFELTPKLEPAINQFVLEVDIKPTWIPLGAELVSAELLIDASLTAGLLAKVSRALAAQCELDIVKLIGNKLNIELSVAFPLGPIPGQLTIKIQPVLKLEAGVEAKVEVTFAPEITVGARAGVAYTKAGGWTDTFDVTKSGSTIPTFPDVGGEVSLSGKVSAGLKLATLLYDTAGPTVAVTHFGEAKLTAKVPECTWETSQSLGTDITIGAELQVPVFDKTILEVQQKFNLATLPIGTPKKGALPMCGDAGVEAGVDAGPDAGPDAGVDAGPDAEVDAMVDAMVDATVDGPPDAAVDTVAPDSAQVDAGGSCVHPVVSKLCASGWCTIPAGCFVMGSPSSEACRHSSQMETQHEVTLTHSFEIQDTEVTQAQYQSLTGSNPSWNSGCADCPVEKVSWEQAAIYCNALSTQNSLQLCYDCSGYCKPQAVYNCKGYRLPTEAEWEYAYRAGTTSAYYNGANDATLCTTCSAKDANLDIIAWFACNKNATQPVGQKLENGWGLHDMAGNVWEYTNDVYASDLGSGAVTDPDNSSGGGSFAEYVARGGAISTTSANARAARRSRAQSTSNFRGFRCVRTLP